VGRGSRETLFLFRSEGVFFEKVSGYAKKRAEPWPSVGPRLGVRIILAALFGRLYQSLREISKDFGEPRPTSRPAPRALLAPRF